MRVIQSIDLVYPGPGLNSFGRMSIQAKILNILEIPNTMGQIRIFYENDTMADQEWLLGFYLLNNGDDVPPNTEYVSTINRGVFGTSHFYRMK